MIIIEQSHKEAIKQVCQSAASRSHIQAFENIMIRTLESAVELKAGDSLIELTKTIPAEVKSGFETTVNAAKFLQSFNACGGDVTITLKDKMTIKSGSRRFALPVIPVESYPAYPDMEDEQRIGDTSVIKTVKSASWASGVNDVRHVFNGVFLGEYVAATNGHKMSLIDNGADCSVIIPIEAIKRIPDVDGEVYISDYVMCIKSDDLLFKTKLVDGRPMDYTRAIPKTNKEVTVDVSDFTDAVRAAQITANSQFKTIVMHFGKESTITAASADKREESSIGFACDTSVEFDFAVNSSYLIEALSVLDCESVTIEFSDDKMMINKDGAKSIISYVRV